MLARLLRLHPSTYKRLVRLSKEAEREGAYRVAKRLQAVVLNSEGQTSGELARILKAPRSKVSEWLQRYQSDGVDGLLEGYRSGRPSELTDQQQQQLGDILDSGPVAYGLDNGIWTSPMIAWVIEEEFGVQCAQVAACLGIFGAASAPHSGPRRCRGAGPLAPPDLSEP
jgi:transposase